MPSPRHAAPAPGGLGERPIRYLAAAIVAVLVTGLGALTSQPPARSTEKPQASASIRLTSQVEPRVVGSSSTRRPAPAPAPTKKKKAKASPHKPAARKPVTRKPAPQVVRWLPTGTGMWLHDYGQTMHGNGRAIVHSAQVAGLTHLFVQTGSSHKGWIGSPGLRSLMPATRGTSIKVIAWDFADLEHPEVDARRLARAARYRCTGCPRVAAVAPDIETAAEGTRISGRSVVRYYDTLRRSLPADVAILATVPWPSEVRRGHYPYAETAHHADAMLPMAYWYNRAPGTVTSTSISYLRRFHRPVMPVGQGYDSRLDAPYLAPDPHPYLSVRTFTVTARQMGAPSVSLWSWQTTGGQQWRALVAAKKLYAK